MPQGKWPVSGIFWYLRPLDLNGQSDVLFAEKFIRKISFCWLGSFKSLAHSFCFFLFAKEITLFCVLFTLLVLLPCLH